MESKRARRIVRAAVPMTVAAALAAVGVVGVTGALPTAVQARDVAASVDTVDIEAACDMGAEVVEYFDSPIERTVSVENEGVECWVRMQTTISANAGEVKLADASLLDPEEWTLAADGWFYRTEPLAEAEVAELAEPVSVPEEWGRGFDFEVVTCAQAVQRRNVEPDFASASPWGGVEPERAVYVRAGSEDDGEVGVQPREGASAGDEAQGDAALGQEGGAQ